MSIKTILLPTAAESSELERGPAAYALSAAKAFGSQLTGLFFEIDVVIARSAYGRSIAAEARADAALRNQMMAEASHRLEELGAEKGVAVNAVLERSFAYTVPDVVAEQARLHDLTVVGVDQRGLLSEHAIAEFTLFQSGQPLLVVPSDFVEPFACERVIIAWDFSRVAARAVSDALPFLQRASEVTLVSIGDEKPMDSSLSSSDVVTALARRGVNAIFQNVERGSDPIDRAIAAASQRLNADLLVMGGYGHSRFREFILGGATRGILKAPLVPTLLSH